MPDPAKLLATVRRAAELVTATPGRTGHRVALRNCKDLLVAGDLHGHIPNFKVVLTAADLTKHPGRHLVLQELIHSSFAYPQGGEKSHQLVDLFCALKCQFPDRVHYLPGNHELAQFTNRPIGKGETTCNAEFRFGVEAAYGVGPAREIYDAYMDLFRRLPLAVFTPNRVAVSHSLPAKKYMPVFDARKLEAEEYAPEDYLPGGSVYALVWGRDTSLETVTEYLRRVDADFLISGHIPLETGSQMPTEKHLIVDCSATPAAYVLIPADRPVTRDEILAGVKVFS
jgi:hypothetical protein